MVVEGLTKRLLRTEYDHDRLELVRERLKGRTKQERLGETKRVNESGFVEVKLKSNDRANRRVHGGREVERTRRRDESADWLKVSGIEERRYEQFRAGQKPKDVDASTKNWTLSTTKWKKTKSECCCRCCSVEARDSTRESALVGSPAKPLPSVRARTRRCRIYFRGKLPSTKALPFRVKTLPSPSCWRGFIQKALAHVIAAVCR
jgi:hypothetical protein